MHDPRQQFRVLYRDFLLRMVDLEVLAAGGDVQRLLGQLAAVLAGFGFVVAIYLIPQYVGTTLPHAQVALLSWGNEEFLISTTMAVVGIFGAIAWDAVFPDRRDSLILGMLPVATGTIFRAKVAALGAALGVSVAAVNLFTGLSFPFMIPVAGALGIPRAFAAYWVAMACAGLFMFCALLALQGLAAQVFDYRTFLRVSNLIQLLAFFAILGVYFLTPGPTDMALSDASSQRLIARLPSFWFLALFQKMNGTVNPAVAWLSSRAVWGLAISMGVAATTYGLAYYRNVRRIIEQPDIAPSDRSRPASRMIGLAARKFLATSLEQAIFLFIARTLARSRQHRVILAAFGGMGLAVSLTFARSLLYGDAQMSAMARRFGFTAPHWYEPNAPFMAAGFVMLFFVIFGMRAVFSLPATLKANWMFRMTAVHSPRAYFAATRKSVYWLGAAPVWIAGAVLYLAIWPRVPALAHLAIMILVGITLVDRSLTKFRKVPFACSYLPGKSDIRFRLGAYGLAFLFVTYAGANLEESMGETVQRSTVLFAVLIAMAVRARMRWWRFAESPQERLQFEDVEAAEVSPLHLSDAGAYSSEERYIDVLNAPPEQTFAQRCSREEALS